MKILSFDLTKHYRRSNSCRYNSHSKWPGRRLNAVASHSGYGQRNPRALSRYINGEAAMHHTERKSFRLLCRYTLAESWAALRKAWLGFKISNSNDDMENMRYYARIIRKLQLEMGIPVTHFDIAILDGGIIWQIEQEVKAIETERRQEIDIGSSDPTVDDSVDECEYDYEENINNAALNKNIPSPREEIFHSSDMNSQPPQPNPSLTIVQKHILNSNSCLPPSVQPGAIVEMHKKNANSCKSQPNHGEAIVKKRVFNRNLCPYSSYDSSAEFENPDQVQIKQDITNSESQKNSQSPWPGDSSLETNMTLIQDDGDLGSDDAIERGSDWYSDPTSEESPAADDCIEPENELPVQVTGYEIRYDRAMRYSTAEPQTADKDNEKTEKRNRRSCQYIPPGRANQDT